MSGLSLHFPLLHSTSLSLLTPSITGHLLLISLFHTSFSPEEKGQNCLATGKLNKSSSPSQPYPSFQKQIPSLRLLLSFPSLLHFFDSALLRTSSASNNSRCKRGGVDQTLLNRSSASLSKSTTRVSEPSLKCKPSEISEPRFQLQS